MSTEFIEGHVMYARLFEGNRDMKGFEGKHEEYDGYYEVCVGVPEYGADYKRIMGWNRMYSPKIGGKDKGFELDRGAVEGLAYFRFGRKHAPLSRKGTVITKWGGPPKVLDSDNDNWDAEILIGNGSKATIKLDVEKSPTNPKISFVRLEAVRIDKLVVYERPVQEEGAVAERPKLSKDNPGDDIPF